MSTSTTTRVLRGLGALLAVLVLLVGIPVALWLVAGSPIPTSLPTWDEVTGTLSRPDVTGTLTLGVIKTIAWIGWATFAIAVLLEIPAQLRGLRAPRLRGLGMQQRAASALIATVIAMFTAGPVIATSATAQALPATTVAVATYDTATPDTTPDAETPAEAAPAAIETAPTVEYTVQRGDSLWSIAETQLGDGMRFQEIADLNYGRDQPGGYALDTSHWIDPGWVLQMPSDAAVPAPEAAPATSARTHVVAPGESLWDIAQAELGDGDRYPEIVEASRDIDQGGGARLTDPDLIRPGWTLALPSTSTPTEAPAPATPDPTTKPEPAPAAEVEASTPAAPTTPEVPTVDEAVEDTPVEAVEEAAGADLDAPAPAELDVDEPDAVVDDVDDNAVVDVRTAAGVGGILAAGVLALLGGKRAEARRRRRTGQRIALPAPASAESVLEQELRAVTDPLSVQTVDVALRSMAAWHREQQLALPDVRAARLTPDSFEVYLYAPADLPTPWVPVHARTVWQISAQDAQTATLSEAAAHGAAPYPSLVTIGHDQDDAHLLLDLERLECLDVRGDAAATHATLAALALELATSTWADDLQVTLVGIMPGLEGVVDTGRIRHVSGLSNIVRELEARAADVTATLGAVEATSIPDARGRGLRGDAWTPEVLLVGERLDPEVRDMLENLVSRVPRVGVAAVTTDAQIGEWVLDIDADDTQSARLSPVGITVRPQQVDASTYAHLLGLLRQADADPVDGPTWTTTLTAIEDEPTLTDLAVTVPDEPALTVVEEQPAEVSSNPTAPAGPSAGELLQLHHPIVKLLGPVEIDGTAGVTPESRYRRQTTELITLLALHPEGTSTDELTRALWPTSTPEKALGTRRSAVSRARRWLGADADGELYLPRFWSKDADADGEVVSEYRLRGVPTDWHVVLELIGDDIAAAPTENLLAALDMVRGRPFEDAKATRYVWAENLAQEIMATIVDVAHEVAARALANGDAATARRAAEAGRRVDPADERVWRDSIRAEVAAGRRHDANRLVQQLRTQLDGLDPDPETEDLLDELADLDHTARQGA